MAENTDIDSIEFRPAEGGVISKTRMMDKPGKNGLGVYQAPKEAVHPTLEHAMNHMKKKFGGAFGKTNKGMGGKGMVGKDIDGLQKESTKKMDKSQRPGGMKKG